MTNILFVDSLRNTAVVRERERETVCSAIPMESAPNKLKRSWCFRLYGAQNSKPFYGS